MAAIDGYEEKIFASRLVASVDVRAFQENSILNCDRVQFACAHTNECVLWRRLPFRHDLKSLLFAVSLPQALHRRVKELFPRMGTYSVAEKRIVGAALQPVLSAVLLIGPTDRQVAHRGNAIVDNCAFADGWPSDLITMVGENLQQPIEMLILNDHCIFDLESHFGRGSLSSRLSLKTAGAKH